MGRGKVHRGRATGYAYADGRYTYRQRSPRMSRGYRPYNSSPYQAPRPTGGVQTYPPVHHNPYYTPQIQTAARWSYLSAPERRPAAAIQTGPTPRVAPTRGTPHDNNIIYPSATEHVNFPPQEDGRPCNCGSHHSCKTLQHYEWDDDVNHHAMPRSCIDTTPKWCFGLPLFLGAIFMVIGGFFTDKSSFIGHGIIFFVVSTVCLAFGTFLLLLEICICSYLCMGPSSRRKISTCTCCNDHHDKSKGGDDEVVQQIPMTVLQPSVTVNAKHMSFPNNGLSRSPNGLNPRVGTEHRRHSLSTIHETSFNADSESLCSDDASITVERPTSFLSTMRTVTETSTPPPTIRTSISSYCNNHDPVNSRGLDIRRLQERLKETAFRQSLDTSIIMGKDDSPSNSDYMETREMSVNRQKTNKLNKLGSDEHANVTMATDTPNGNCDSESSSDSEMNRTVNTEPGYNGGSMKLIGDLSSYSSESDSLLGLNGCHGDATSNDTIPSFRHATDLTTDFDSVEEDIDGDFVYV